MKLKLYVLFFLFPALLSAQEWFTVSSPDIRESLNDIHFSDADHGWAVGNEGLLMITTDGGVTWTEQPAGVDKDFAEVFFIDNNTGWIGTGQNFWGTAGGTVLKTTDGGSSWTEYDYSSAAPWVNFVYNEDIQFLNENVGYMLAGKSKNFYLLKSTDGGVTWAVKDSISDPGYIKWTALDFKDENNGIIVSNFKQGIAYTKDGGETVTHLTINDNFFDVLTYVKWLEGDNAIAMGKGNEFNGKPTAIYKTSDGGATWVKKNVPPVSFDRVEDAYFIDNLKGIGVGSNGFGRPFMFVTEDGGNTWTASHPDLGFSMLSIAGAGENLYVIGTSGHLAKSADFGVTWTVYAAKTPSSIYGIAHVGERHYAMNRNGDIFKDLMRLGYNWEYVSSSGMYDSYDMAWTSETTGYLAKENSKIVKTTDGGETWTEVKAPVTAGSRNKVGGISFGDENTGYAWFSEMLYEDYHVYKTTDAGASWEEIYEFSGPSSPSGSIDFFDANNGFIAGPKQMIKYTNDGGVTWQDGSIVDIPADLGSDFEDVCLVDENTAWGVGSKFIVKTTDRGVTWNYIEHGIADIDSSFFTISMIAPGRGVVGCFDGTILRTDDGGATWEKDETFAGDYAIFEADVDEMGQIFVGTSDGYIFMAEKFVSVEDEANKPYSFSLEQNYPNPFNPATRITYSVKEKTEVELAVYDILGRKITTLAAGVKSPGSYTVTFDGSELSSGVYLYKFTAAGYSSVRKMMILK